MEIRSVNDQTESAEVTRPILGQEDGGSSNFPISNTRTFIDSENSDKKENAHVDRYQISAGSEISSESGISDIVENMKYTSLEKTEGAKVDVRMKRDMPDAPPMQAFEDESKQFAFSEKSEATKEDVQLKKDIKDPLEGSENVVNASFEKSEVTDKFEGSKDSIKIKRDVEDAPLTLVDEDDGLMKKLGKLCGVDRKKLLEEEYEPYIRSPYNWKHSDSETHRTVDNEGAEMNIRKVHQKQNEHVCERLAFFGKNNELPSAGKQFGAHGAGAEGGNINIQNVHNDIQQKRNVKAQQETQGGRQSMYIKQSEATRGSYPNQTNVQILPPSGGTVPIVTYSAGSDVYNFTHAQRGYILAIVNDRFARQTPRDGAHWDLLKMREIARKFGFRSLNYNQERNLTKSDTLQLLTKARKMDHSDCDCFVFMISTHGLEYRNALKKGKVDHALVCADDQLIFTSTIMDMFNDNNCPSLKGKPKIFFIQACRGEKLDHGGKVFVAFPRNEDKTCSVVSEVEPGRLMRESFDESDTRPGQDSWTAGHHAAHPSNPAASSRIPQGQTGYTRSYQVPTHRGQQPSFMVPRVQQPTHASHSAPYYRQNVQMSPGQMISKIYAPTPYAIVEAPSLKCDNDMLVMFAIPPGMFAWRNTSEGSWMIDYLHQVLMAYDMRRPKNFLNLLTKVTALMSRRTTNTPSNPSMHAKTAVSVIEHKLDKDIVFQQKVPVSEWIKKSKTFAL